MAPRAPVLVILFNRPTFILELMEIVRAARPETLLLVADGPRAQVPDDADACAAAREAALAVDWPCEVLVDFADENLGCARRVATGLRWAFEHVDRAVVLEDDVRPDPSFFPFCDAMLEEHADDERIAHVAGRNPLGEWGAETASYLFSRWGGIWGWATWRRAWAAYDETLVRYRDDATRQTLRDIAHDAAHAEFLVWLLDTSVTATLDTWDIQWSLARHANRTLSVVPARNLVTNVGFGDMATHTTAAADIAGALRAGRLDPPWRPPADVLPDAGYEAALVRYERLRSLSDPRLARPMARLARRPDVRRALRINPATANSLAVLDDIGAARRVLAHVQRFSEPSPSLAALAAGLGDLVPDADRRAEVVR